MKILYFTHCSAKKNDKYRNSSKKVFPKQLYTAAFIQRFIKQCEKAAVEWSIFSDKHGFVFPNDKISWYEKHPSTVTNNQTELHQLLDKAYHQLKNYKLGFFYYNPGRFHHLYELLISYLKDNCLEVKRITHLYEIREESKYICAKQMKSKEIGNKDKLIINSNLQLITIKHSNKSLNQIKQSFVNIYNENRKQIIRMIRQIPSVLDAKEKFLKGKSYRAIISPEVSMKMKTGAANWNETNDGFMESVIRENKTGRIITHIKLEEISQELLASFNQIAIQHTLAEILQQLEIIDQKITDVLKGQRNDRLAIVESGINLYQQAITARNPENRNRLLINAIDKLNEGRQKLILSLDTEIDFVDKIPRKFWKMVLHSPLRDYYREIQSKAYPVLQSFQAILRSSFVLISAYEILGESESLHISLTPLRDTIIKNREKIEQIARLLPYDPILPPEESWRRIMLQLSDNIVHAHKQVKHIDAKIIEIPLKANELLKIKKME